MATVITVIIEGIFLEQIYEIPIQKLKDQKKISIHSTINHNNLHQYYSHVENFLPHLHASSGVGQNCIGFVSSYLLEWISSGFFIPT